MTIKVQIIQNSIRIMIMNSGSITIITIKIKIKDRFLMKRKFMKIGLIVRIIVVTVILIKKVKKNIIKIII